MTNKPADAPEVAGGPGTGLITATAACGLVLGALPIFLVGGLAVQIRAELGFTEAALGAAVTAAFLTGACAGPLGGRLADRLGARAAVLIGTTLSVAALGGIGWGARSWGHLTAMLVLAGLGFAVTDPGLAILVTRFVPRRRQGLAFGVKEASVPMATLAAGLAVPAIALTLGWRWAFTVGLVPLAGLALLLPRIRPRPGAPSSGDPQPPSAVASARPSRAGLVALTAAAALGCGAASGIGIFLTESAVAMGLTAASAGFLLATGGVAGVITRITSGVLADRDGGEQLGVISWMLAAGAVAMALGATGAGPLLVVGAIGAFSGGWGWTGLLFLSLVRALPSAPGVGAGIGVLGLGVGNALGPLLFGVVAQSASFGAAWLAAAAASALAAALMRLARAGLLAPSYQGRT